MKNKNTLLIEIATQCAGNVFSRTYWRENRSNDFNLNSVPALIEFECENLVKLSFAPEDKISERDVFMCKMYAVQYYNEHMAKILEHKASQDGVNDA